MFNQDDTVAPVDHLEAALTRLETGSGEFPGAYCDCLQDVTTAGHLVSCILAGPLDEIRAWRKRPAGS